MLDSTGDRRVDRIVQGVIGIFEQAFPGRILGCYLRGSRASGTSTAGSDIDLFVVFKDQFQASGEAERAHQVGGYCAMLSPILLEIIAVSERQLHRADSRALALQLKLSSRPVSGHDLRSELPELAVESYVRSVIHTPYFSYRHPVQRRDLPALTYPLRPIDPAGAFYGYDQLPVPGPDGIEVPSAKLLVGSVGWTATAIIARQTGRYVRDKSGCVELYRQHIADEWTELVVRVHELCRNRWHYLLPAGSADRAVLRELCEQALAFQNHFLGHHYRPYHLAELRSAVPDRQLVAARRFGQIVFPDGEVAEALERLRTADRPELRQAADATLERYALVRRPSRDRS